MKAEGILRALLDTTEDEVRMFLRSYEVDEDRMINELLKSKHGEAFIVGEQGTTSISIADLERAAVLAAIGTANDLASNIKDELKERQENPELIGKLARLNLRELVHIEDGKQELVIPSSQYQFLQEQAPVVLEVVQDTTPYKFSTKG